MSLIEKAVIEIRSAWNLLFTGIEPPTDSQIAIWIMEHDYKATKAAIGRAGRKFRKLNGAMDHEYLSRYISALLSKPVTPGIT